MSDRLLTTKEKYIVWAVLGSAVWFWLLGIVTFIRWVF